jgi:hypothetical protein
MSAQGLNAASYNGFYFSNRPPTGLTYTGITFGAGIPRGFPTRDASDYTRLKKQVALYAEYKTTDLQPPDIRDPARKRTGSTQPYNNPFVVPVDFNIVQTNENRLSYQFGLIGCSGCSGGFPNIPLGT